MMQPESVCDKDVSSIIELTNNIWYPGEYDDAGRVTRELKGENAVRETSYNDDPNGNWLARWVYYDLSREQTKVARPDLVAWVKCFRNKSVVEGEA